MTHQSHQNPESPLLGKKNLPGLSLSLYPYSMGLIKLSITFINMIYCRSGDFHLRMTSTILLCFQIQSISILHSHFLPCGRNIC